MKDDTINKYFFDILDSIHAIEKFIKNTPDYNSFLASRLIRSAVERELQIIGEALNAVLKISPNLHITNTNKIKGTRNIIVHDYDGINYRIIWNVLLNDLPILKGEVMKIIDSV